MYLLYFILWLIFNGAITLEIILFGIGVSSVVFAFTCKFTDWSLEKEKRIYKNAFSILHYIVVLVIEILKANFSVIHMILSEEEDVEPALVRFDTELESTTAKVFLANAITLTPGTITVLLEDGRYTVHCLDESLAEGIDSSVFVEMLSNMEKK